MLRETIAINGKEIHLETGRVARQAHGAILARDGATVNEWLFTGADEFLEDRTYGQEMFKLPEGEIKPLTTPLTEEAVRGLKTGDVVLKRFCLLVRLLGQNIQILHSLSLTPSS